MTPKKSQGHSPLLRLSLRPERHTRTPEELPLSQVDVLSLMGVIALLNIPSIQKFRYESLNHYYDPSCDNSHRNALWRSKILPAWQANKQRTALNFVKYLQGSHQPAAHVTKIWATSRPVTAPHGSLVRGALVDVSYPVLFIVITRSMGMLPAADVGWVLVESRRYSSILYRVKMLIDNLVEVQLCFSGMRFSGMGLQGDPASTSGGVWCRFCSFSIVVRIYSSWPGSTFPISHVRGKKGWL